MLPDDSPRSPGRRFQDVPLAAPPRSGRALLLAAPLLAAVFATADIPAAAVALAASAEKALLPGIGPDDHRVVVDSVAWPWSAIGRVNNTTGLLCTGTLVAPDAVLTAAHCVTAVDTGQTVPASAIHFLAGYRRGEYLAHAVGTSIETGTPPPGRHPTSAGAVAGDWAIVRVAPPLAIRPLPITDPPAPTMPAADAAAVTGNPGADDRSGPSLQRAGYSQDRPHMLAVDDGCRITAALDSGRVLLTDCDATRGDSGSPLLLRRGADAAVVGVISAVVDRDAARGALVVPASAFRAAASRAAVSQGAVSRAAASQAGAGRP